DRPLETSVLRDLAKRSAVTAGKFVMPGDRFEGMRPPYQVVKDQLAVSRFDVPVQSAGISSARRTIILQTATRRAALSYAVRIPNVSAATTPGAAKSPAAYDDIELHLENNGLEAKWVSASGNVTWNGWLPHL